MRRPVPRVPLEELTSVLSEIKSHGVASHNPGDCDYCDWIKEMTDSDLSKILKNIYDPDPVTTLMFFYCGIQIGRNQILQEELESNFGKGEPA